MANIDLKNVTLTVTPGGGRPTVEAVTTPPPVGFYFNSPTIDANASVRLTGTPGERLNGWVVGFIQLKYIGTNYARYRGMTDHDGSLLVTQNNQTVCRDTDQNSTEVWYDSLRSGGAVGPRGTNALPVAMVIPRTGFLDVQAHLYDRPDRSWASVRHNTSITSRPENYLYHTDTGLAFCTMLVAKDPADHFHLLRHFYWNVRWEQMYRVGADRKVVADRTVHLEQNIQAVQTGGPTDHRFRGREYDLTLPVSNTISRRDPREAFAKDWRQM